MNVVWQSDVFPERNQFASWREVVCQHVYGVTPERVSGKGFRGKILARRFGELDVTDLECEGHLVARRREDIARTSSDTYYIYCQLAGRPGSASRDANSSPRRAILLLPIPTFLS